jgi:L-fuculose-phosphate aldolase
MATTDHTNTIPLFEAKSLICESGLRLVREGMVARTWGNISLRVSPAMFVVTPSGIPYDRLTPEKIVEVTLPDMTYSGTLKQSSEKDLHGFIY